MARWSNASALAALLVAATLVVEAQDPDDWYPADIRPPAGTSYPCVLTPLPRGLPGIPEADRGYINHAYTLILRATQAKLVVLRSLEGGGADMDAALALQRAFFEKATPERRRGAALAEVYRISEGREASQRLIAAWGRMQQRYRSWPKLMADSIYHHLCALDPF